MCSSFINTGGDHLALVEVEGGSAGGDLEGLQGLPPAPPFLLANDLAALFGNHMSSLAGVYLHS